MNDNLDDGREFADDIEELSVSNTDSSKLISKMKMYQILIYLVFKRNLLRHTNLLLQLIY